MVYSVLLQILLLSCYDQSFKLHNRPAQPQINLLSKCKEHHGYSIPAFIRINPYFYFIASLFPHLNRKHRDYLQQGHPPLTAPNTNQQMNAYPSSNSDVAAAELPLPNSQTNTA